MSLRLPVLGEHMREPRAFSLGVNLQLPRAGNFGVQGVPELPQRRLGPTPVFGFDYRSVTDSTSSVAVPAILGAASAASAPGFPMPPGAAIELLDLIKGSGGLKTKLNSIAAVVDAVLSGKELADEITKARAAGQSQKEAVACQTIKAITKGILGDAFTGAISAGIPVYLAAAQLDPRIKMTLPIILPLLPYAYKGAGVAAGGIGGFAEGACHVPFH